MESTIFNPKEIEKCIQKVDPLGIKANPKIHEYALEARKIWELKEITPEEIQVIFEESLEPLNLSNEIGKRIHEELLKLLESKRKSETLTEEEVMEKLNQGLLNLSFSASKIINSNDLTFIYVFFPIRRLKSLSDYLSSFEHSYDVHLFYVLTNTVHGGDLEIISNVFQNSCFLELKIKFNGFSKNL